VQQAGGTVQDVNNVVRIKALAEWQAGDILKEMEKAKGTRGQLQGKASSGGAIVKPPEDGPTLVEMGLGATVSQAKNTAYRVRLVRDAADKPADIDAVIDRRSAQGKQVSSNPIARLARGW
jgi:hypothetical protein